MIDTVSDCLARHGAMAPLREDALADAGLGWPAIRRALRELGRRLVAARALSGADGVFWERREES